MTNDQLQAVRTELRELMGSWQFAFASGHGCSIGDHPDFRATRARVDDLRAILSEHQA